MAFHQLSFLATFCVFYLVFMAAPQKHRNLLMLAMSYFCYGLWDWRLLSLLIISTVIDYCAGWTMDTPRAGVARRRIALGFSLVGNLGLLCSFKYFNFFIDSAVSALGWLGFEANAPLLNVVLPAGISFYTFQTLAYTIDVYRREIPAERNPIDFAAFVSYFPQLVAGPIERARDLLPQIKADKRVTLDGFLLGVRLFGLGLFKKLFVADNLGTLVDYVFSDVGRHTPLTLLVAGYCFTFQIYCDFSAYTDMGRGLGRMTGIQLRENFNLPLFAESMRDFWRRWHMTLSTWFRDYVYFPLGGNRRGVLRTVRNLVVTFAISGLWHRAGWNFILWGLVHGCWVAAEFLLQSTRLTRGWRALPSPLRIAVTFHVVVLTFVLFRCQTLAAFGDYWQALTAGAGVAWDRVLACPTWLDVIDLGYAALTPQDRLHLVQICLFAGPLLLFEFVQLRGNDRTVDLRLPLVPRMFAYSLALSLLMLLGTQSGTQFIYFQF